MRAQRDQTRGWLAAPRAALERRAGSPDTPVLLARVRVLFFLFGLVNLLLAVPSTLSTGHLGRAVLALASLLALGTLWTRMLTAGHERTWERLAEVGLMFAIAVGAPVPEASLGVFYVGLNFGSLFGALSTAVRRAALYFLAFAAAFAWHEGLDILPQPDVWAHAWGAVVGTIVMALLARAVRAQAASERAKDEFLAVISHELRTPLTAILGFLQSVEERGESMSPEQVGQLLTRARVNAERQRQLIEDLLDVSRIIDGTMVADARPVALAGAVDDVVTTLDTWDRTEQAIPEHHVVVVDPPHLQHIVSNLLSNAAKYGAPPFEITSDVSPCGALTLRVRDHGRGVPADFEPYLFDRFAQASTGDRRTAQGVGLGLWIARELARANEGDLWYEADGVDGACFAVLLPAGETHAEPLVPEGDRSRTDAVSRR